MDINLKKYFKRDIRDTLLFLYVETYLLLRAADHLNLSLFYFNDSCASRVWPEMTNSDAWFTGNSYFCYIAIWIITLLWMCVFKKNRPLLKMIWTRMPGNTPKNFAVGLGIGFGLNGICILTAWLNNDIVLYFDSFRPISFIIVFITVFIQSSAEEFLCRCFLYGRLRMSYKHPATAIIGCSLFFTLIHLWNPGMSAFSIINIALIGVLFSLMVYYMDSPWCAFAAHAAWNFSQSIIFGLPNSGLIDPYSVFKLDAASAHSSFAYDVDFGIEGTLMSTVVFVIACIALYVWGSRKKKAEKVF